MENFQTPLTEVTVKPARPTFLTVLCILTFIGSGWGIVSGFSTYMSANVTADITQTAMQDAKDKISNAGETNAGTKMAEKMLSGVSDVLKPENLKKSAMFSIVACVFTLLGAVLMFQLKKIGFWIYLVGTVISIVGPIVAFGAGNLVSMATTIGMAFIGVIFVVLYGLNLKHLR
jgi:hypothetical protein